MVPENVQLLRTELWSQHTTLRRPSPCTDCVCDTKCQLLIRCTVWKIKIKASERRVLIIMSCPIYYTNVNYSMLQLTSAYALYTCYLC
jgi:hypothetical protein